MSAPLNVLISGSGIAGGAFAFCLLRAFKDAKITVVERDLLPRLTGASVDIRDAGVDVIKWMGLEPAIRAETTKEEGTVFVGANERIVATFRATGRTDIQSITSEYEILRGALAKVLFDPIEDKVKRIFNDSVDHYEQHDKGVTVTFASQKKETYDLLVAADGLGSKIRGMILNAKPREQIVDEGCHAAYFSINKDILDRPRMAEWHNMTGGRAILLRPDPNPAGRTRGYFMNVTRKSNVDMRKKLGKALEDGHESYKQLLEESFRDGGWKTEKVLQGMRESDDFYCSLFAQVRSPRLQDGRVVLVGDAGYATPGIGTSLAMIGGYVLAGELMTHPNDHAKALSNYEATMLKLAKSEQGHAGVMQFLNPQTQWGIRIRDTILSILAATRIHEWALIAAMKLGFNRAAFVLPKYAWPEA